MTRERPTEIHDRNARAVREADLRLVPSWLPEAARSVSDRLRAFADRYPDRFEYVNGKLQQKRSR